MSEEITPHTKVSMTVVKWCSVIGAVVAATWIVGAQFNDMKWTLRSLNERVATVDARVQQFSPASLRDEARRVCREVLGQTSLACSCVRGQGGHFICTNCKARGERDDE